MKGFGFQLKWDVCCIIAMCVISMTALTQAFDSSFSHRFSSGTHHFSPFGGNRYLSLNPGMMKTFKFKDDPSILLKQITLNAWEKISVPDSPRNIHVRVLEEQFWEDNVLMETHRYMLSRSVETGDIFCFGRKTIGQHQDNSANIPATSWRYGVDLAKLGLFMPGQLLLGSRFYRESAPGFSMIKAQIESRSETYSTSIRDFTDAVSLTLFDDLGAMSKPKVEWYAAGVGLMSRDGYQLVDLETGTTGLPLGGRFVPYSDHPYYPLAPGMRWIYEGREDFQDVRVEVTVLTGIREIEIVQDGNLFQLPAAVVESREWIGGGLHEVNRTLYTQCVETQDVFYIGEEVDLLLEGGAVVIHDGSWLAGVDGSQPGVIMPGDVVLGARYLQEFVPNRSVNQASNDASGLHVKTPFSAFEDCIRIVETSRVYPDEPPSPKLYAPGVGLVDDDGVLKLVAFEKTSAQADASGLRIQNAVLLEWPWVDEPFRLELSRDLKSWESLNTPAFKTLQGHQTTVPVSGGTGFYRLSFPSQAVEQTDQGE